MARVAVFGGPSLRRRLRTPPRGSLAYEFVGAPGDGSGRLDTARYDGGLIAISPRTSPLAVLPRSGRDHSAPRTGARGQGAPPLAGTGYFFSASA